MYVFEHGRTRGYSLVVFTNYFNTSKKIILTNLFTIFFAPENTVYLWIFFLMYTEFKLDLSGQSNDYRILVFVASSLSTQY